MQRSKICGGCNRTLSVKQFHKNKCHPDGFCTQCKDCKTAYGKKYWLINKKKLKVGRQKNYKMNKRKILDANLKRNAEKGWEYRIKERYGVTPKQYYAVLKKQGGGCYICGSTPKKRKLHIDHCHKTGQVRGLLCMRCNRGLSWFSDSPERLSRAAKYLKKNHKKHWEQK